MSAGPTRASAATTDSDSLADAMGQRRSLSA